MIADNLRAVNARIAAACERAGRPVGNVTLLAVSKTHGPDAVRAAAAAGARRFGENQVQEAVAKMDALADLRGSLEWHLIGPLQSNKTKLAAGRFDWVQTVDRVKIAERLSAQRPAALPPLSVCLQVNTSGEPSKSGFAPEDVVAAARAVAALPRLRLRGLMAIPEPTADAAAQRAAHRRLAALRDAVVAAGVPLDTLSAGMSDDLEAAIAEGSTLVRVGSAIFGARPAPATEDPVSPPRA
jgi:pyridoxal phosphate enzyme (YggS family)